MSRYSFFISSFQEWANAMARRPSSVRLSVRLSVNFCANRFFSHTNGRIATKLSQDGLLVSVHPGYAQGQAKVKVKGHVIRALSWILGMSYSVIDGLVHFIYFRCRIKVFNSNNSSCCFCWYVQTAMKCRAVKNTSFLPVIGTVMDDCVSNNNKLAEV